MLESERADEIGQRVWRIGENKNYGFWRHPKKLGKDLSVDFYIHIEQPEPACRIIAVCGPAAFFIGPGGDNYNGGTSQI